jgi:hypothetical protein
MLTHTNIISGWHIICNYTCVYDPIIFIKLKNYVMPNTKAVLQRGNKTLQTAAMEKGTPA